MLEVNASDFLHAAQIRTSRVAVSASATRNQGIGVVMAARDFLNDIQLIRFSVSRAAPFRIQLDLATDELRRRLPRKARSWGLSRKLLNIFLS